MSTEVEALEQFFAALNRNDMQALTKDFDPQIVRVEPEGFTTAGTDRGIAEGQEHVEGQHADGQIITSVAAVHDTGAAAPRERHRLGITAEHRGPNAS